MGLLLGALLGRQPVARGDPQYKLPGQIERLLYLLNRLYEQKNEALLREIVVNSQVSVDEATHYDNWNGGMHGHSLTLVVPTDTYVRFMDTRADVESRIQSDLSDLVRGHGEYFGDVLLQLAPLEDEHWREESGVYRGLRANSAPREAVSRIWGPQPVRVFLSHKAGHKAETSRLKQDLQRYGIGAFVAHEDIEPTREWAREIEYALTTMDALVALLTPDFHDSDWTDQEVGAAIGRGVPLIAVRLGQNPYGLMGTRQGLGGCDWSRPEQLSARVYELLRTKLPDEQRVLDAAIQAYSISDSFATSAWTASNVLSRFAKATPSQVNRVIKAHEENSQNAGSYKSGPVLAGLLRRWTGEHWASLKGKLERLELEAPTLAESDDLPF